MDTWSAELLNRYDDPSSEGLRAHLLATAGAAREETVLIEHGHATIRRTLIAKSVHAKKVDIEGLNVHKLSRYMVEQDAEIPEAARVQPFGHQPGNEEIADRQDCEHAGNGKRRCGQSAWSLFCSAKKREDPSISFSQSSAEYRMLSPSAMSALQKQADDINRMASSSSTPSKAPPKKRREKRTEKKKRRKEGRRRRLQDR